MIINTVLILLYNFYGSEAQVYPGYRTQPTGLFYQ